MKKQKVSIYSSGGIKKGPKDKDKLLWKEREFDAITKALSPISVVFLRPDERTDDIKDAFTVFGRDHYQISICDFVIVDLRQRRGIGVGIEMLSAKRFQKPLICVVPPNTHYRRNELKYLGAHVKDYIHAHLLGLADVIVDDFAAAGTWIKKHLEEPRFIKDVSVVDQAIAEYKKKQLKKDLPMQRNLKLLTKP